MPVQVYMQRAHIYTHTHTQHEDSHSFSAIMWCCHGEGGLRHNSAIVLRGRGGPIRETDCSPTVTLPAPVPTALPPTEIQTHPLAKGPACTGPYHHGNQNRRQCLFHTSSSNGNPQDQGTLFFQNSLPNYLKFWMLSVLKTTVCNFCLTCF